MIIDAHLHADCRPVEDFKNMKIAGVNAIVSCAYDPLEMKKSNVSFEHFDRIINREAKRVENEGIKLYCAVGVHPRAIPTDFEKVIEKLPEYLEKKNVIAIGEIGLESADDLEQKIFVEQLKIADENNYKIIVHTPRTNKVEITEKIVKLLDEHINPRLVQLDHVDFSIVDSIIDKEYSLGITIQPLKMSTEETIQMLEKYGYDKFVLDSDISYAPSNPLSLPETKHELEKMGVNKNSINKVMFENVLKFYNIKL
ncbi:TatD family hydrolase [Methanosphaera sp.]|uniref:TatD family hydrolase n=1 Tax=Methanosphaera sp. TaxID=2666342 RepID=UPI002E7788C6|nr:TatD family hydrolase [Methanosphaera sp.]MEE1118031.1 TatD family hydrolase [Methanosphaera sp.]